MKPEHSFPCSQEFALGPYPEPNESIPPSLVSNLFKVHLKTPTDLRLVLPYQNIKILCIYLSYLLLSSSISS